MNGTKDFVDQNGRREAQLRGLYRGALPTDFAAIHTAVLMDAAHLRIPYAQILML